MASLIRILDANANRAREALRVMEEAARFILEDAALTEQLKTLRHDLVQLLSTVPGLESNRDTPGDVGTRIDGPGEYHRAGLADVAAAAGKRLTEALRALEEYLKPTAAAPLAVDVQTLRYRAYELERQLNVALVPGQVRQWCLCVLLTEALCVLDWREVLEQCLDAGADCVQLREKGLQDSDLLQRARFVVQQCRGRATSIVNDRPDIAMLADADGVHLGQHDLPPDQVRKLFGRQLLVGISTADLDQARRARREGADYCGIGPMFATTTKVKHTLAGPSYLQEYLTWGQLPHLAIGGITVDNIAQLVTAGVQGIAVSSAICGAPRPGQVVAELLQKMGGGQEERP